MSERVQGPREQKQPWGRQLGERSKIYLEHDGKSTTKRRRNNRSKYVKAAQSQPVVVRRSRPRFPIDSERHALTCPALRSNPCNCKPP